MRDDTSATFVLASSMIATDCNSVTLFQCVAAQAAPTLAKSATCARGTTAGLMFFSAASSSICVVMVALKAWISITGLFGLVRINFHDGIMKRRGENGSSQYSPPDKAHGPKTKHTLGCLTGNPNHGAEDC